MLLRTLHEATQIEQAGRNYLLAYRTLNSMSSSMGVLAWVLTPKWHVSWFHIIFFWWPFCSSLTCGFDLLCFLSLGFLICWIYELPFGWDLWVFIGHAEAFAHVVQDAKRLQLNPRFTHTFGDEDFMSQLKKWARRGHGRRREQVISRLSRMRFKTLRWKLGELKNRVRWKTRAFTPVRFTQTSMIGET